jgi:heme-degrading monooxygenase HmoA
MSYFAISIASPLPGHHAEAEMINQELMEFAKTLDGCIGAYALKANDGSEDVARVSIWETEEHANRGIQSLHAMALRSELHLLVRPEHLDRGFFAITEGG